MAEINYIIHETSKKGRSYASVAKQMNHDSRTVKKYADQDDWGLEQPKKQKRRSRVMEPVKPILDQWIQEDLKKKKKYQRTAKRMYQQLIDLVDFEGSYRSVRRYVSKKKRELIEVKDAALPLETKPGSAQVDFGECMVSDHGKLEPRHYLVVSFPYSNAFYFQMFQSQNSECFLEGLARIFDHMGGVPPVIRFDNLSPAVKKILPDGERELTDSFQRFVWHYGFDYAFCNAGKGNEKGHVEAMVKYIRNNFLLPEPTVVDLEGFNQTLWQMAEDDRNRPHYLKNIAIETLFEADKKQLIHLAAKRYMAAKYDTLKADKYGLIQIEKNRYSASPRWVKKSVMVKITYDEVAIYNEDQELIVSHPRSYGQHPTSMKWPPYLKLMAKRPNALKYTSFYDQLPPEWQTYLDNCTRQEKQEALKLLATILKSHHLSLATKALRAASVHGHPSADSIQQMAIQLSRGHTVREKTTQVNGIFLPSVTRKLTRYDELTEGRR